VLRALFIGELYFFDTKLMSTIFNK